MTTQRRAGNSERNSIPAMIRLGTAFFSNTHPTPATSQVTTTPLPQTTLWAARSHPYDCRVLRRPLSRTLDPLLPSESPAASTRSRARGDSDHSPPAAVQRHLPTHPTVDHAPQRPWLVWSAPVHNPRSWTRSSSFILSPRSSPNLLQRDRQSTATRQPSVSSKFA